MQQSIALKMAYFATGRLEHRGRPVATAFIVRTPDETVWVVTELSAIPSAEAIVRNEIQILFHQPHGGAVLIAIEPSSYRSDSQCCAVQPVEWSLSTLVECKIPMLS